MVKNYSEHDANRQNETRPGAKKEPRQSADPSRLQAFPSQQYCRQQYVRNQTSSFYAKSGIVLNHCFIYILYDDSKMNIVPKRDKCVFLGRLKQPIRRPAG
jgi:hypothetical protein